MIWAKSSRHLTLNTSLIYIYIYINIYIYICKGAFKGTLFSHVLQGIAALHTNSIHHPFFATHHPKECPRPFCHICYKNRPSFGPLAPPWMGSKNPSEIPGGPNLCAHMYIYICILTCMCTYIHINICISIYISVYLYYICE